MLEVVIRGFSKQFITENLAKS